MSDILTRLLLNTSDYDSKLRKAKGSTQEFGSMIGGKVAGMVGKFAAGIGVAMGGVEAFNKVINSSQETGDAWNNTLNACKGTVDAFFQSLSTGDWGAFNGGLLETLRNMREVSALRDTLDDAKLTMGFDVRQFEREYVRLEGIIDDETKSKGEREAAFADMQQLISTFRSRVEATGRGAAETLVKELNAKFGKDFTLGDIEKYIKEVNNEFLNTETLHRLNKYKEELSKFKGGSRAVMGGYVMTEEQFKAANAELEKLRILQNDNDENRSRMVSDYEYVLEMLQRAEEYHKRSLEKQNKVAAMNKVTISANKEPKAADGSLAAIDAEIKKAQQEYANTASAAAREAAMRTIEELQNKKGLIELHARVSMPSVGSGKTGSLAALAGGLPTTLGPAGFSVGKEEIRNTEDYANAINSVANALTAVSTATGEGAAAFLSWASSVMTATAQAVQAIHTVVAAKTAEAAASAGASAASTPVVGWLMIGGAIAAALAAFTKIPKFADGGIVGGSSYFGDKLLARVNSGEMILNKHQQSRLLSLTDGGGVRVSGDVRLSGKDIYISLRNYLSASGNKL